MRSHSPADIRLCSAYCPTGTVFGLPMTMRRTRGSRRSPGCTRSIVESAGLITTRTLRAKFRRVAGRIRSFCWSSSIWREAAEMNTSTGAPASICFCSSPDEPKLKRNVVPGWPATNWRPVCSTASFMLMAADSVNSCATADAATASTRTNASARALMPRIIRSRSGGPALLDDRESPVHEEDQDEQEHSQRDGRVEVALARLEHHRRGQRTRVALDVAADHQRGADLGDDGAEAGHDGGQHRQPSLPQHDPHHLSARGAERDELETERLGNVLDGGQRDAGHDRRGDHRLRDNHRDRRVEDLQHAERPAPPEQDRDEE